MKPDASPRRDQAASPRRDAAASRRDAGLALISRINRWMVAGAIALAGLISIAAKGSFHGHSQTAGGRTSQAPQSLNPSSSSGSQGLQQPAQAPSSVPVAPAPVVSGGS